MNFNRFPKPFLFELALELDIKDLLNFCLLNKDLNKIACNNYRFWEDKIKRDFGLSYSGEQTLKNIKEYYKKFKESSSDQIFQEAARLNDKALIDKMILEASPKSVKYLWDFGLEGASEGDHKELVDFFISKGASLSYGLIGAARGGHKNLLNFFLPKVGLYEYESALLELAKGGHLELFKYLEKIVDDYDHNKALFNAVESGNLNIVNYILHKWSMNFYSRTPDYTVYLAAKKGYKNILKLLLDHWYNTIMLPLDLEAEALKGAKEADRKDIIKFLKEYRK